MTISANDLAAAAREALTLANIPMAQRFAQAAVEAGGGLGAVEPLARALMWQGRADDAERPSPSSTRMISTRSSSSVGAVADRQPVLGDGRRPAGGRRARRSPAA